MFSVWFGQLCIEHQEMFVPWAGTPAALHLCPPAGAPTPSFSTQVAGSAVLGGLSAGPRPVLDVSQSRTLFVLTFFLSLNEHCPTHRCVELGLISQGNFKSSSKNLCFVWLRMPAGMITQQGTSAALQAVPVVKINSEAPASQGCQSSRNICF